MGLRRRGSWRLIRDPQSSHSWAERVERLGGGWEKQQVEDRDCLEEEERSIEVDDQLIYHFHPPLLRVPTRLL